MSSFWILFPFKNKMLCVHYYCWFSLSLLWYLMVGLSMLMVRTEHRVQSQLLHPSKMGRCTCVITLNLQKYNYMQQSPSEKPTNSHLAGQEISCSLWNLRAHICGHNSLPLVTTPIHMNPYYSFKAFLATSRSPEQSLPLIILN